MSKHRFPDARAGHITRLPLQPYQEQANRYGRQAEGQGDEPLQQTNVDGEKEDASLTSKVVVWLGFTLIGVLIIVGGYHSLAWVFSWLGRVR